VSVALVLCLNAGVDPPDTYKTQPCARLECWVGENGTDWNLRLIIRNSKTSFLLLCYRSIVNESTQSSRGSWIKSTETVRKMATESKIQANLGSSWIPQRRILKNFSLRWGRTLRRSEFYFITMVMEFLNPQQMEKYGCSIGSVKLSHVICNDIHFLSLIKQKETSAPSQIAKKQVRFNWSFHFRFYSVIRTK